MYLEHVLRVYCQVSCAALLDPQQAFGMASQQLHLTLNSKANYGMYAQGELSGEIHKIGIVQSEEFVADGSCIKARVPVPLAMRLAHYTVDQQQQHINA